IGEMNYNYTISGNNIENYENGLVLAGKNYEVFNNTIKNCKNSITLGSLLVDSKIHNNKIYSNIEYSRGYFSFKAELNNVNIKDEIIEVSYRPINLSNLTTNNSNSPISFTNSRMISNLKTDNFIDGSKNI